MNTLTKKKRDCSWKAALVIGLTTASILSAQEGEEPVYELSPFEVSTEGTIGYRSLSTNAVAGVRTDLKDTPISIEVFNQEMLDDLGAFDLDEALQFATNITFEEGIEDRQSDTKFRGLRTRFSRRNNFIWYNRSDNFSVGRIEVVKGPNALLYGDSEPGGVMNVVTKQAMFGQDFGQVDINYDQYGSYRGTIDINVANKNKYALRIAGLYEDQKSWLDGIGSEEDGIYLNGVVQPIKGLQIRAEYEQVSGNYVTPTIALNVPVADADWESQPVTDFPEMFGDPSIGGGILKKENVRSFHGKGRQRFSEWEVYSGTIQYNPPYLEGLSIEMAYNHHQQSFDATGFSGATFLHAPSDPDEPGGTNPLDEYAIRYDRFYLKDSDNEVDTFRVFAQYELDFDFMEHRIIGSYYQEVDEFTFWENGAYQLKDPYGDPTDWRNWKSFQTNGWHAISEGPIPYDELSDFGDNLVWGPLWWGTGFHPTNPSPYQPLDSWYNPILSERNTNAWSIALQSFFWDDRIITLLGYRLDDFQNIDMRRDKIDFDSSEDSINGGLIFKVNKDINIFLSHSESFKAAGSFRRNHMNEPLDPAVGESFEYGIKFDLWDDKWSGVISVYDITFTGDVVRMPEEDRDVVDPSGLNGRNGQNNIGLDTHSTGWEFQLIGNPLPNFTTTIGIGYVDATVQGSKPLQVLFNDGFFEDSEGYLLDDFDGKRILILDENNMPVEVHKSLIEVDEYGHVTDESITNLGMKRAQSGQTGQTISQVTGQPMGEHVAGNPGEALSPYDEYSINAMARYDFVEGPLEGFGIGAVFRYRINRYSSYTGSTVDGNRILHFLPDYYDVRLFGHYSFEVGEIQVKLGVSIDNLFNKAYDMGWGFSGRAAAEPRSVSFNARLKF